MLRGDQGCSGGVPLRIPAAVCAGRNNPIKLIAGLSVRATRLKPRQGSNLERLLRVGRGMVNFDRKLLLALANSGSPIQLVRSLA